MFARLSDGCVVARTGVVLRFILSATAYLRTHCGSRSASPPARLMQRSASQTRSLVPLGKLLPDRAARCACASRMATVSRGLDAATCRCRRYAERRSSVVSLPQITRRDHFVRRSASLGHARREADPLARLSSGHRPRAFGVTSSDESAAVAFERSYATCRAAADPSALPDASRRLAGRRTVAIATPEHLDEADSSSGRGRAFAATSVYRRRVTLTRAATRDAAEPSRGVAWSS